MVWIDIVLLIIIVWFAYKGLRNGFIIELSSLIALLLAVWTALKYGNIITDLLKRYLSLEGNYVPFISFVLMFIAVLLLVSFVANLITKALQIAYLGILNRLLGLFFSILKVGIILSLLINGFDRVNKIYALTSIEVINNSYLYQPLNSFAEKIYEFSNSHFDEAKKQFDKTVKDIQKTNV